MTVEKIIQGIVIVIWGIYLLITSWKGEKSK